MNDDRRYLILIFTLIIQSTDRDQEGIGSREELKRVERYFVSPSINTAEITSSLSGNPTSSGSTTFPSLWISVSARYPASSLQKRNRSLDSVAVEQKHSVRVEEDDGGGGMEAMEADGHFCSESELIAGL